MQLTTIREGVDISGMSPRLLSSEQFHVLGIYLQFSGAMPEVSSDESFYLELVLDTAKQDVFFSVAPETLEQTSPGRWRAVFGQNTVRFSGTVIHAPMVAYLPDGDALSIDTHRSRFHVGNWSISLEGKVYWESDEATPSPQYVLDGIFYHSRPTGQETGSEPKARLWLFNQEGSGREMPPEPPAVLVQEEVQEEAEENGSTHSSPAPQNQRKKRSGHKSGHKSDQKSGQKELKKSRVNSENDLFQFLLTPNDFEAPRLAYEQQIIIETLFSYPQQLSFNVRFSNDFHKDLKVIHNLFDVIRQDRPLMMGLPDSLQRSLEKKRWDVLGIAVFEFIDEHGPLSVRRSLLNAEHQRERILVAYITSWRLSKVSPGMSFS